MRQPSFTERQRLLYLCQHGAAFLLHAGPVWYEHSLC
jgi:hypothetical protein